MTATVKATVKANAYAGSCTLCGGRVEAGAGHLGGRVDGRWTVEHATCPTTQVAAHTASPARATSVRVTRSASHGGRCEQCGRTAARLVEAVDMSGIAGMVCFRCDTDGDLSFS